MHALLWVCFRACWILILYYIVCIILQYNQRICPRRTIFRGIYVSLSFHICMPHHNSPRDSHANNTFPPQTRSLNTDSWTHYIPTWFIYHPPSNHKPGQTPPAGQQHCQCSSVSSAHRLILSHKFELSWINISMECHCLYTQKKVFSEVIYVWVSTE